jgi:hypothetical protein
MNTKIELGQFYTRYNPFEHERFRKWLAQVPNLSQARFIEPFGGSNSLVEMILRSFPNISSSQWSAFDIHPEAQERNLVPSVRLQKRDTMESFPEGYNVCITNPPYLAKNSATRKGLGTEFGDYQDLFELALEKMLKGTPYVAAIIPESFITRNIFRERLEFVISLNFQMFDDTEFPVCLAVFSPSTSGSFEVWRAEEKIAVIPELDKLIGDLLVPVLPGSFRFNDPEGIIGLNAIDGTKEASIRFRVGDEIPAENIKVSSRSLTRISSNFFPQDADGAAEVIQIANTLLAEYRRITNDVYLTSFKGLRSDGLYRRRLDWKLASLILGNALVKQAPDKCSNLLSTPKLVS